MIFTVKAAAHDIAFPCDEAETVLDAAERAGYSLPYSCRKGVCSTCEGALNAGEADVSADLWPYHANLWSPTARAASAGAISRRERLLPR